MMASEPTPSASPSNERMMRWRSAGVPTARNVQDYALRVLEATHPESTEATPKTKRYVRYGASPRGGQACLLYTSPSPRDS